MLNETAGWMAHQRRLLQRALRRLVPNIPLQALVRGANGVGYTSYPYASAPFYLIG